MAHLLSLLCFFLREQSTKTHILRLVRPDDILFVFFKTVVCGCNRKKACVYIRKLRHRRVYIFSLAPLARIWHNNCAESFSRAGVVSAGFARPYGLARRWHERGVLQLPLQESDFCASRERRAR